MYASIALPAVCLFVGGFFSGFVFAGWLYLKNPRGRR